MEWCKDKKENILKCAIKINWNIYALVLSVAFWQEVLEYNEDDGSVQ